MRTDIKKCCFALMLLLWANNIQAQGPGSTSTYGGPMSTLSIGTGSTTTDASESLYIGPGTYEIDGTWEIYSKQIIIDPSAVIGGTGTIIFYNPSLAGGAASSTLIDGNAVTNSIDVNLQLQNTSGMQLTDIAFPSDLVDVGFTNDAATATLYVGADLDLAVDGADVSLGTGVTGDLVFDADATISNYQVSRMVITNNSLLSHMVKEHYTSAFTFPVGIADGDYTPAQVSNSSDETVHVSVQNYVASLSSEATADPGPDGSSADGMNRTWHIYGNNGGISSTINLQHNTSTNQSGFNDASHFVTRWGSAIPNTTGDNTVLFSTSAWQSNTAVSGSTGSLSSTGSISGSSMCSRIYSGGLSTTFGANEQYFTKSSDPSYPLPVQLISFQAIASSCDVILNWTTGQADEVSEYLLLYSMDGRQYSRLNVIASKGSNNNYSYRHIGVGAGTHLYRLGIVKTKGNCSYSQTKLVQVACSVPGSTATDFKVYPNPGKGTITISGPGDGEPATLCIRNGQGVVLKETGIRSVPECIDINYLPQGTYLLEFVRNSEVLGYAKLITQ